MPNKLLHVDLIPTLDLMIKLLKIFNTLDESEKDQKFMSQIRVAARVQEKMDKNANFKTFFDKLTAIGNSTVSDDEKTLEFFQFLKNNIEDGFLQEMLNDITYAYCKSLNTELSLFEDGKDDTYSSKKRKRDDSKNNISDKNNDKRKR